MIREKLSAQQNHQHWTKNWRSEVIQQVEMNRCDKNNNKRTPFLGLLIKRRQKPHVSDCCPICFTSQFGDHQMPGGLNPGYTKSSANTLRVQSSMIDVTYIKQTGEGCSPQTLDSVFTLLVEILNTVTSFISRSLQN